MLHGYCQYSQVIFLLYQDEFLDVIYWIRQVCGVSLGLIWGLLPLTGITGLFL